MTPAERLRAAAEKIRETAKAAARWEGYWEVDENHPARVIEDKNGNGWDDALIAKCVDYGDNENGIEQARHIALWSPPVALAVADWLDNEALVIGDLETGTSSTVGWVAVGPAVALADLILGSES